MPTSSPKPVPTVDINALFADAVSHGTVSQDVLSTLSGDLGNIVVAGAAGRALEDLEAAEVTLVTLMVDVSSSIFGGGRDAAIISAQNALVDHLANSPRADDLMVALWLFDNKQSVVHAYVPVEDALRLDAKTFKGGGATALYDTWIDGLMANVAYAQRLRAGGTPCQSLAVVFTDGEDNSSKRRAADCMRLSKDLIASETFTLGFVGVGNTTNFTAIAKSMGLPDDSIAVDTDPTPASLERLMRQVSMAAIQLSMGQLPTGQFSGQGGGGFF